MEWDVKKMISILGVHERNYIRASEAMVESVSNCYPQGTTLKVRHTHNTIAEVEVISKQAWWNNPDHVRCRYVNGIKVRDFHFRDILEVVSREIIPKEPTP